MYIGSLCTGMTYAFYHRGTEVQFPPDSHKDGVYTWEWDTIMDTGLDLRCTLAQPSFVGSVHLPIANEAKIAAAEILVDGKPAGRYAVETGHDCGGEIDIPVGVKGKVVTIRLHANLKKIAFAAPEILGAYEDKNPLIWPSVAQADFVDGKVAPGKITADGHPDAIFAADFLRERLSGRFGVNAPVVDGVPVRIALDASFTDETYQVEVTNSGITLAAGSRITLLYAVETLLQMGDNGKFRCGKVLDRPYKPMRGFHFGLPPRQEMEFARRLLKYVLIPLRYNQLFIEFAGGMRFDRHPKISEAWLEGNQAGIEGKQPPFPHGEMVAGGKLLEKDEVRDFIAYAKSLGFEIIPEVQSWGHVQYITYAYPEIGEVEEAKACAIDTRGEDARPASFYTHCYCPSNKRSYEIIHDIIDEIIEVTQPQRLVHMGHDEIYQVGICPVCRNLDAAELYDKHVTAMHDYLADKGYRMMIWADMLHPTTRYLTPPAIRKIPKDIILLDFIWYFNFGLDYEDALLPHGFEVLMGNMYSSHYPRYEARTAKERMIGGQVSTWCRMDEYTLAKKGKFFDLLYSAEMLWNPAYQAGLREAYNRIITQQYLPRMRDEIRGITAAASSKASPLTLPAGSAQGIPDVIREAYPAATLVGEQLEISVEGTFDRLVFAQATLWNLPRPAWKPLRQVGTYEIVYADGQASVAKIEYAGNVVQWNRRYAQPLPQQYYRHQGYIATWWGDPVFQGKTNTGEDALVLGFVWENPRPDVAIEKIICREDQDCAAGLFLAQVQGMSRQ